MSEPIFVTQSLVPDAAEYTAHIMRILSSRRLTNIGDYAVTLENELRASLGIPHFLVCANGTLSLQLALHAAKLQGREVITTPFSYVASVSALLWEGCTPVFGDIDEETLCLDPHGLEDLYTEKTAGILPVHIYGNACDVEGIAAFAEAAGLATVYDAAQTFGCIYNDRSLLSYGDFATVSFHATKVFHTVEGGGVACNTDEAHKELQLLRAFGHVGDEHYTLGINAKLTEPHAAMGLCLLHRVADNIAGRKKISRMYDALFPARGLRKPRLREGLEYNYAYYPVIFGNFPAATRWCWSIWATSCRNWGARARPWKPT